jgi:DNA (cytosine-5)-methyltransferase 1
VRYLSVCSGIEAASVAWRPLGWTPVAFAEIEKFPCAVLQHHYPNVPNLGDVRKITREQIEALGHIDVVVFGFPCQDLSIAGKRAGLKGKDGKATRSGLFFDAMRIVRWSNARWAVAENVPGLFSSHGGRDFASVVGEMAGVCVDVPDGGWVNSGFLAGPDALIEWAILDAQFFGVPQRRRRVFLVRDTGDWRSRPPLLLIPESLSGYPPPSRETGKGVAPTLSARTKGGGGLGIDCDGGLVPSIAPSVTSRLGDGGYGHDFDCNGGLVAGTLSANGKAAGSATQQDAENGLLVAHALRADGFDASEDGTGRGTPLVPVAIQERAACENPDAGPDGAGFKQDGLAYTLEARSVPQAVAFDTTQITSKTNRCNPQAGDPCHPIAAQGHPPAIAFGLDSQLNGDEELIGPLTIGSRSGGGQPARVATQWAVRRITVTEAERLQGFSDGYTAVPYRGKMAADGPKYKALGNSMAVPCMRWIGERIQAVEEMKWK